MTRLILVRHGQSTANLKHIFAGHKDEDLTSVGHMQAEKTGDYLLANYQIDVIYSSDLLRAYHTAKHIADKAGLQITTEQNLREIYAAKWQGLTFDHILESYREDYEVWLNDIGNVRCSGGESVEELSNRVCLAVDKIVKQNIGKTILIVTHATPIRALQCKWSNYSLDNMKNVSWVPNSSVTIVDYADGNYHITECGIDHYLEGMQSSFPANV